VVTLATQAGVAIENARLYEQAAARQRRLEAINEVTQAILGGHSVEDVLRLIARRARELVGADLASVAIPEGDAELVVKVADGRRADTILGKRFPAADSISGEVMGTRTPLTVDDVGSDPRTGQPVVGLGDMGPALFLPLAVQDRTFGTLTVANGRGGVRFTSEDLAFAQVFAAQAAVALDHARLREDLRRLAVLEDRERIAKELHDGVVQSLFAVGMSLQATEAVAEQSGTVRLRLTAAVEDIDRVIRDLRNYIFGLRPGGAADRGLEQALQDLVDEFRRGSDIAVRLEVDPEVASLLAPSAHDVGQVAREALANAVRHSGAQTLSVVLVREGDTAVLEVEDDGVGFRREAAKGVGQGLDNLEARAEALKGALDVETAPQKGTTVRLRIPL
jgi:signal transduction histidine kinase